MLPIISRLDGCNGDILISSAAMRQDFNPVSDQLSKQTGGWKVSLLLGRAALAEEELTGPLGQKRSPDSWGDICGTTVSKRGGSGVDAD